MLDHVWVTPIGCRDAPTDPYARLVGVTPSEVVVTQELANLIAKKFIARPDVYAEQKRAGYYEPVIDRNTKERKAWSRAALEDHLAGNRTFGHYLLSKDGKCKLFAFDIDLRKNEYDKETGAALFEGSGPSQFGPEAWTEHNDFLGEILTFDPREAWLNRAHAARPWIKKQLREVAAIFVNEILKLDIPCAVAYSGAKGIHVYGFTGLLPAMDVREGADIVLDAVTAAGGIELYKGKHFYKFADDDPIEGYPNLSIEVFPKQDSLDGKDLGNLMRLPLGRNLKTTDPTFFVDMTSEQTELKPVDPIHALTSASPYLPATSSVPVATRG